MDARGPGSDGLAELTALLGSDDWAPLNTSAQAALAQASSAIAPALPAGPSSGRPPLPDSRPRHSMLVAHATPAPVETGTIGGLGLGQHPLTRPQTPGPLDGDNVRGQSSDAEQEAEHALPDVQAQGCRPLAGAQSQGNYGKVAGSDAQKPAKMQMTEEGKAEFVKVLTAKIAEAAQQVALGAISSSVNVRSPPFAVHFD